MFPIRPYCPGAVQIAPSILAADFSRLGDQVRAAAAGGADMMHIDIMDGHFVPNLTMGPCVVKSIRGAVDVPFDVHLMLTHPAAFVEPFIEAGADHITIHVESADPAGPVLETIHAAGCTAGVTLRPGTAVEAVEPFLEQVDMVLVMTVEPGFGGQQFMAGMMAKVQRLRQLLDDRNPTAHIQVDGGVNADTAAVSIEAGASILVAGSSVFRNPDLTAAIAALRPAASA